MTLPDKGTLDIIKKKLLRKLGLLVKNKENITVHLLVGIGQ